VKKLVFWALIAILGLALISGCGGGKKAGGAIVGKVNDMFHGGGVEGAKVTLASEESVLTTTTDTSGNFTFSDLSPGRYELVVTREGFFDNKFGGVKVEQGKETSVEINLIVAFGGT